MNKSKFLIRLSLTFILLGLSILISVFVITGFDIKNLNPYINGSTERTYVKSEKIENIDIVTSIDNVKFLKSKDQNIHVVCYDNDIYHYSVEVKEGNLHIEAKKDKVFFWGGVLQYFHFRKIEI